MSNVWCHTDLSKPVAAPLVLTPAARSRERFIAVVEQFANQARYVRRDVDNDGDMDTFCNFFAVDVMAAMSVRLPQIRANDLYDWLAYGDGAAEGWRMVARQEAAARAELGYPGIATYQHMDRVKPGHVAVVVPSDKLGEVRIAQAGRRNFISEPLANGFGSLPVTFWVHN